MCVNRTPVVENTPVPIMLAITSNVALLTPSLGGVGSAGNRDILQHPAPYWNRFIRALDAYFGLPR
jgi:hypothetical protein